MQLQLFVTFLLIYVMALSGNTLIIFVVCAEPHLHTPMYFFLCNLSLMDLSLISTILPKLLHICLTGHRNITYLGCLTQIFSFVECVVSEYCILAIMAFDRYVAICNPLRYSAIMNRYLCTCLALIPWICGLLDSFTYMVLLTQYKFCKSNVINHLYCDLKPLLKLSCSNTRSAELVIQVSGSLFGFTPLVFITISYVFIIFAILKIRSTKGKHKAFSTCSSHITVVILFFGIILGMYMRPKSAYSIEQDKVFSVLYTFCIPALNPVIYTLRNENVKVALRKLIKKVQR
ncbi:olfactory receptor 5V1-like [Pyxicephalus adspersus]